MAVVKPIKPPRTNDPREIQRFFEALASRFSYISDAGDPTGATKPRFYGDLYYDTTGGVWYKAYGLGISEWALTGQDAGLSASGTVAVEESWGISHAPGVSTSYSRGDHTHGTPVNPVGAHTSEYNHSYLVTGGDAHDHVGGDGAQIDHGGLSGLTDDDHTQYVKHALATAASDFLVASGSGTFVKKTLAETKTILGLPHSTIVDRGDPSGYDKQLSDLTTDGTWRDLDLSAIVPDGAKAVILRVNVQDDAAGNEFDLRKNGNSNAYNTFEIRTQVSGVSNIQSGIVFCDTSRVIEYYATNTTWTHIYLVVLGWIT